MVSLLQESAVTRLSRQLPCKIQVVIIRHHNVGFRTKVKERVPFGLLWDTISFRYEPIHLIMDRQDYGFVVWFTGLSGSGKTTLSRMLEKEFHRRGRRVEVLDGDVVRTHLSKGLGFSKTDRDTNIRRIGFVCQVLSRNGVVAVAAAISPYRVIRDEVRGSCGNRFVEIYVKCPLAVLLQRDEKGLYRRAVAGEIPHFTGISDPYEEPSHPEITVETDRETPEASKAKIVKRLEELGYL